QHTTATARAGEPPQSWSRGGDTRFGSPRTSEPLQSSARAGEAPSRTPRAAETPVPAARPSADEAWAESTIGETPPNRTVLFVALAVLIGVALLMGLRGRRTPQEDEKR